MKNLVSRRSVMLSALSGFFSTLSVGAGSAQNRKMALMPTRNGSMPCGSCDAPAEISSATTIASANEPGEPLAISGIIYQQDGKTPAQGMVLFLFHTDATGHYNQEDDPIIRVYGAGYARARTGVTRFVQLDLRPILNSQIQHIFTRISTDLATRNVTSMSTGLREILLSPPENVPSLLASVTSPDSYSFPRN